MQTITFFYFWVVFGIFASACSQILLKQSADNNHKSWLASMLNWRVILAYLIFFGSLIINITAMSRGVNLKDLPVLESLGYVFVPILSWFFLKEKIDKRILLSMTLIIIGIIIFYQ